MFDLSWKSREARWQSLKSESFDLLVVGGGITGAACAREAIFRGLKVALVEKSDYASGTSSGSSKLIHGGLRYLEKLELSLVFEALQERAYLLKRAPHLVSPIRFQFPVYEWDRIKPALLNLGLTVYDLLSLFRGMEPHCRRSQNHFKTQFPGITTQGLQSVFEYSDAIMWDDALVFDLIRDASERGLVPMNWCEALEPVWSGPNVRGVRVRSRNDQEEAREFVVNAKRVLFCGGPWSDLLNATLTNEPMPRLKPSRGAHIVLDRSVLPIHSSLVMSSPQDHRIAFAILREDLGPPVVIVGTTDGAAPKNPDELTFLREDFDYLKKLLEQFFPNLCLRSSDVICGYTAIRPLVNEGGEDSLQDISREHWIGRGPGGTTFVAGGKYTTHRAMAAETINSVIEFWREDCEYGRDSVKPSATRFADTKKFWIHPSLRFAPKCAANFPKLSRRYRQDADLIVSWDNSNDHTKCWQDYSSDHFGALDGQARFAIQKLGAVKLQDIVLRRIPLFLTHRDHAKPIWEELAEVWAQETSATRKQVGEELDNLADQISRRESWRD